MPTMFIWGTFDELGVLKSGEKLAAEVAGARSHVFEGVAHMVNLERPAEFNQLVGDFLDEVDRDELRGHPARLTANAAIAVASSVEITRRTMVEVRSTSPPVETSVIV